MASNVVSSGVLVNPGDLTLNTSTQQAPLGARAEAGDRTFRYVLAGGTALVPGKLQQASAELTNHQDMAPTATAIGATSVSVTPGATAGAANLYAEGWLIITVTPGQGYQYRVSGHAAISASTAFTVNISDPIVVALTTSSRCDLVMNPYKNVVVNPTTATSCPVGAAVNAVTAAYYGWLQTGGVASILADGAVAVGTDVVASNATAGAVEALTGVQAVVGNAVTGIATTEYGAVNLFLN